MDKCAEIECPNYTGNRLDIKTKYKAAKWLTDYTPSYDQYKKLSAADKLILDVIEHTRHIVGGSKHMHVEHVLPHFPKADIILCKDIQTGKFVEPAGFENYIFGDVMYPHNTKDFKWYAVVIVGWNNTVRNTVKPVGLINFKTRHLKVVGYNPVLVIWNEYMKLPRNEKLSYIINKLN